MVWGSIWLGGWSKLVVMEQDYISNQGGFTANSYIKTLEDGMVEHYRPGLIFQQDNTQIHTAIVMQEWFEHHGIHVVDWPPHLPDLNPIEHVWNMLKTKLLQLHLFLFTEGRSQADWSNFEEAIQETWWAIPQEAINCLIESMPHWVDAVFHACGWYIKY